MKIYLQKKFNYELFKAQYVYGIDDNICDIKNVYDNEDEDDTDAEESVGTKRLSCKSELPILKRNKTV